jgi:hypothetical protein
MKRVVIESPYAGNVERNVAYARGAMLDCLARGEAPYASHLLYTQVLDDDKELDRNLGIVAGFCWAATADLIAFYADYGWSRGMLGALEHHFAGDECKQIQVRVLHTPSMETAIGRLPHGVLPKMVFNKFAARFSLGQYHTSLDLVEFNTAVSFAVSREVESNAG